MRENKKISGLLPVTLWIFCAGLTSCHTFAAKQNSSPENLAQNIFQTFQARDSSIFMEYVISPSEIDSLPDQPASPAFLKISKSELRQELQKNRDKLPVLFAEIIRAGEREFGSWNEARYERAEYKLEKNREDYSADYIDIFFFAKGDLYRIRLDDCLLTKRGWVVVDGLIWQGRVKRF